MNFNEITKCAILLFIVTGILLLHSYSNIIQPIFAPDTSARAVSLTDVSHVNHLINNQSKDRDCVTVQVRQWKNLTLSANKSTIGRSALAQNIENFFIEFDEKYPDKPLTDATQDVLAYLHELQNRKIQITDDAQTFSSHRGQLHILASYHSGSTFTGQLFKTHPSVYYMFEPLIFLDLKTTWRLPRINQHLLSHHLVNLLNCSFMDTLHTSFDLFSESKDGRRKSFFRASFPGDKTGNKTKESEMSQSMKVKENVCEKEFNYTAIKTIRCESLLSILPSIIRGTNTIQLLRDPRGLFASRIGYVEKDEIDDKRFKFGLEHMSMECGKNERNFQFLDAITKLPAIRALFDAHFRFVRYEDIAYDTFTLSQAMFEFAGIRMTKETLTDIIGIASNSEASDTNTTSVIDSFESDKSKAIATKWRHKVPIEFIRAVEGTCFSTLKQLHYNILLDDQKYRDDKYELVDKLDTHLFQTFTHQN